MRKNAIARTLAAVERERERERYIYLKIIYLKYHVSTLFIKWCVYFSYIIKSIKIVKNGYKIEQNCCI